MNAIILDDYRDLFKDEESFRAFIEVFRQLLNNSGMPLVLSDNQLLFTAVSPEATKEMLCGRILKRLSENPEVLGEMKNRLEEDIVD